MMQQRLRAALMGQLSFLIDKWRYRGVKLYEPGSLETPTRTLNVTSAWKGNELVIADLLRRFNVGRSSCLEFGVEFGFSTVAFSQYFRRVIGVDLFTGDIHTQNKAEHFEPTRSRLAEFSNIELYRSDYRDWIAKDDSVYDLIHVDIVHTFDDTYRCGLWSAQHSTCTLFHDTESFPEVKRAVQKIANDTRKEFYNYSRNFGLGIIV
jgi:hypothetical protein